MLLCLKDANTAAETLQGDLGSLRQSHERLTTELNGEKVRAESAVEQVQLLEKVFYCTH